MRIEKEGKPKQFSQEHKKKVLWEIFAKLDKALQGCGELDLPLFGEILLSRLEEIVSEFEPNNTAFKDLKERVKKIRNCEPNPDYNIFLAKSICQKLLEEF
jgi:hypothetical protein